MKHYDDELVKESPLPVYHWPRTLAEADIPDPHPDILATINSAQLQPVVELPEDWHEVAAPPDWAAWQPTEPLPLVTVTPRTPRRYLALAACIVPLLAVAGDVAGRWLR